MHQISFGNTYMGSFGSSIRIELVAFEQLFLLLRHIVAAHCKGSLMFNDAFNFFVLSRSLDVALR